MKKQQAELLVTIITELLSNKKLVTVSSGEPFATNKILINQTFKKAYYNEYTNGDCSVAIRDSWGIMTGAEEIIIDPNSRSIHAHIKTGYRELIKFSWTLMAEDDGEEYQKFKSALEKLWKQQETT
jgi:hypothetical protein